MGHSEAKDLRSFLNEPVEEIGLEDAGSKFTSVQASNSQTDPVGVPFRNPSRSTNPQTDATGIQLPNSQTNPVGASFRNPSLPVNPWLANLPLADLDQVDLTLQQTTPIPLIPDLSGPQSGLNPYRLQHYQSQGTPVPIMRSVNEVLELRQAGIQRYRETADLVPASQKIVPNRPSATRRRWERRRRNIYMWLVLLMLFLLVILGGIGLDSLLAVYH